MFWGDPDKMIARGNKGQRCEMDILFLPQGLAVFYVTSCVSEHPAYLRTFFIVSFKKELIIVRIAGMSY